MSEHKQKSVTAIIAAIKCYSEGYIKESIERSNFLRRIQQPGKTFNDFLVFLNELVKTCNICSKIRTQKNIRDQIIEGLLDGDAVKALLQENSLTLVTAINKCQAQEAAKEQKASLASQQSEHTFMLQRPQKQRTLVLPTPACPGCRVIAETVSCFQYSAYSQACFCSQR